MKMVGLLLDKNMDLREKTVQVFIYFSSKVTTF